MGVKVGFQIKGRLQGTMRGMCLYWDLLRPGLEFWVGLHIWMRAEISKAGKRVDLDIDNSVEIWTVFSRCQPEIRFFWTGLENMNFEIYLLTKDRTRQNCLVFAECWLLSALVVLSPVGTGFVGWTDLQILTGRLVVSRGDRSLSLFFINIF